VRIRKLQYVHAEKGWTDQAYLIEDDQGQVEFRYDPLTWGRVGAALNKRIRQENIPLEDIESIMPPKAEVRWLPIEVISGEEINDVIAALDEACKFPKPQPISMPKPVIA
jgi:hypothetical protein